MFEGHLRGLIARLPSGAVDLPSASCAFAGTGRMHRVVPDRRDPARRSRVEVSDVGKASAFSNNVSSRMRLNFTREADAADGRGLGLSSTILAYCLAKARKPWKKLAEFSAFR